jgi:hypothetical protein
MGGIYSELCSNASINSDTGLPGYVRLVSLLVDIFDQGSWTTQAPHPFTLHGHLWFNICLGIAGRSSARSILHGGGSGMGVVSPVPSQ